jgi:hypothetical protein
VSAQLIESSNLHSAVETKHLEDFLHQLDIELRILISERNPCSSKSTIFCAVYSKDPLRYELLENHLENVLRIDSSPAPLYVFENGDEVPQFARPYSVVADKPLTIYQAWRIATHLSTTELVGNLNLDDRFLIGGFELMESYLLKSSFDLVGGEWLIDTGQLSPLISNNLRYTTDLRGFKRVRTWPPERSGAQILGSGIASNGTFGPATLWRAKVHQGIDLPTRFANGEVITRIGDSVFWSNLARRGYRLGRVPALIGTYQSHPESQAEFRDNDDERNFELSAGKVY